MLIFKTEVMAEGISGEDITDFMLNCTDEKYQAWWRGTHFQFHTIKRFPGSIGNLVYMDEMVGQYRITMKGVVLEAAPGKRIVWQMVKGIKLPAWVTIDLENLNDGAYVTHTLSIGFKGIGKIFDPIFRLYFSKRFEEDMDEHARIEFPRLKTVIS